jgi:hypothetical protein
MAACVQRPTIDRRTDRRRPPPAPADRPTARPRPRPRQRCVRRPRARKPARTPSPAPPPGPALGATRPRAADEHHHDHSERHLGRHHVQASKRRHRTVHIRRRHQHLLKAPTAAGPADSRQAVGPADPVQQHQRAEEAAGEPGDADRDDEQPRPARGPLLPGDRALADERQAHGRIGQLGLLGQPGLLGQVGRRLGRDREARPAAATPSRRRSSFSRPGRRPRRPTGRCWG